jgi:ADP-ribosylglycohydrolase
MSLFLTEQMPPRNSEAYSEKIRAAFLAAAAGDALGWPFEPNNKRIGGVASVGTRDASAFQGWTRRQGTRFAAFEESISPGEYSDDTQLLVATARALRDGGQEWADRFARFELPAWLVYERGGGRSTKASARAWAEGVPPWASREPTRVRAYFASGGNGVAMRVLPHVLWAFTDDQLRRDVLTNGFLTHGHPRALVGALAYASAARIALVHTGKWNLGELIDRVQDSRRVWERPPDSREILSMLGSDVDRIFDDEFVLEWQTAVSEMNSALNHARHGVEHAILASDDAVLTELGAANSPTMGAGNASAAAAIYLASRYAAEPATGVRVAAVTRNADTDTLASMTGGLLGLMLGGEWIPHQWRDVQDSRFLARLATSLDVDLESHELSLGASMIDSWTERDARVLRDGLEDEKLSRRILGPLGPLETGQREPMRPLTRGIRAYRWQMKTHEGQTLYISKTQRQTGETSENEVRRSSPAAKSTKNTVPSRESTARAPSSADGIDAALRELLLHVPSELPVRVLLEALVTAYSATVRHVSGSPEMTLGSQTDAMVQELLVVAKNAQPFSVPVPAREAIAGLTVSLLLRSRSERKPAD